MSPPSTTHHNHPPSLMLRLIYFLQILFSGVDYLANGLITPESLVALHSLTEFENLMPRFTATVPPCWSEIQQEQQQRRHPQHLQQQGEATQHTRTWKLTQNG